jgi:hypothetical protein
MGNEPEVAQPPAPDQTPEQVDDDGNAVAEPAKLLRLALMLRELQEEVRRAPTDEAGRGRRRAIHDRVIDQLGSAISEELQDELSELALPFEAGVPSESEILIAQAQLIGWLEGLFQGIQAAIFSQQMQARQQLEQMRQRGLPPGHRGPPQPEPPQRGVGQYL